MTASAPRPADIQVVTSDLAEIHVVTAAGAHVISCDEFLARCDDQEQRAARQLRRRQARTPRHRLGDHFPDDPIDD